MILQERRAASVYARTNTVRQLARAKCSVTASQQMRRPSSFSIGGSHAADLNG